MRARLWRRLSSAVAPALQKCSSASYDGAAATSLLLFPKPGPNGTGEHLSKEPAMNRDRIEGNWKKVKGKVKEQWGRLTEDDLDVIAGKREQLLGRIQQRHGIAKDEARRQVERFERTSPDHRLED
jgi:uncharacterized protein YjbJ (UPF0337 family)